MNYTNLKSTIFSGMGNSNAAAAASQQVQNVGVQPAKPLGQNGDSASANGVSTNTYGLPSDASEILDFCKANKLTLIEDAAEAHGQKENNKLCGSFGDMSTFLALAILSLIASALPCS